jgi:RHS repeat-associated protein
LVAGMDAGEMPRTMRCDAHSSGTSKTPVHRRCFIHTWYDDLNRLTEEIDPPPTTGAASPTTTYAYDFDNNQTSETDPDGNAADSADPNITTYAYNALNEQISQTQVLQLSSSDTTPVADTTDFGYDANGNMVQKTDAVGQVTDFSYDKLNRQIGQDWYANSTAETTGASAASNIVAYTYDLDGDLITAGDDLSSYTYTYNSLGQETSVASSVSGLNGPVDSLSLPNVTLASGYNADGDRTSLSATIGSTADFVNDYSYDTLNRETQVVQEAGGDTDAVDSKLVNFTYNADGQFDTIDRFNSTTDTSGEVAKSQYAYNDLGQLTSLTHGNSDSSTAYADDAWVYNADSQIVSFTNSGGTDDDAYIAEDVAEYSYDHDGQLTTAAAPTGQTPNASNSLSNPNYDPNGNATSINDTSTTIGEGNTLLFDGTYSDTYDKNGNLTVQADSTEKIDYTYDNRNRLTDVTDYLMEDGSWTKSEQIDYTYDVFNDLIGRVDTKYESNGVTIESQTAQRNVYDGSNMVLSFDGSGNLTDRYLWGPAVDQVLADEQFDLTGADELPSSIGNTLWSLDNNQNSVTDVINNAGEIQEHIAYSPFGSQTGLTTGSVTFAFGYTGTYTDATTGFQYHSDPFTGVAGRWYNPGSQEWVSQDPLGLAPSSNPYDYVANRPTLFIDPTGASGVADWIGDFFWDNSNGPLMTGVPSMGRIAANSAQQQPPQTTVSQQKVPSDNGHGQSDGHLTVDPNVVATLAGYGPYLPHKSYDLTGTIDNIGDLIKDKLKEYHGKAVYKSPEITFFELKTPAGTFSATFQFSATIHSCHCGGKAHDVANVTADLTGEWNKNIIPGAENVFHVKGADGEKKAPPDAGAIVAEFSNDEEEGECKNSLKVSGGIEFSAKGGAIATATAIASYEFGEKQPISLKLEAGFGVFAGIEFAIAVKGSASGTLALT